MGALQQDEQRQLDVVRDDLVREHANHVSPEVIRGRFDTIVAEFQGAPVRTYVPVLVRRRLRDELSKT